MIGRIQGTLIEVDGNVGLIDTAGGIGYIVMLPPSLIKELTPPHQIVIYTHLHVREDAHTLYGFANKTSRHLFTYLLSVSGVGAKTAHTIVGLSRPEDIHRAVEQNDADFFARIPGLGKKTAMKIIIELAPKLKQHATLSQINQQSDDDVMIEALVSLGFKTSQIRAILPKISPEDRIEERIKKGLQLLTQ